MKIVLTTRLPKQGFTTLKDEQVLMPEEAKLSRIALEEAIKDCDILVPTYDYPIDAALMDMAPNLKLIANFGVGFNNIDIAYAKEKGILVSNTPDPVIEPTAEQAFTLMLATAHRTAELDRKMRLSSSPTTIGVMNKWGVSLFGTKLGILGLGRIGRSFDKRGTACGMST